MVLQSRRSPSISSFLPSSTSHPPLSSSSSTASARLPPTYRRLLPLLLLLLPAVWYWSATADVAPSSLYPNGERSIALSTIVGLAEEELAKKQRAHAADPTTGLDWDKHALGIALSEDEISLRSYQISIRTTLRDVFGWTGQASSEETDGTLNSTRHPSHSASTLPSQQKTRSSDWWIQSTLAHLCPNEDASLRLPPSSPTPHELFTTGPTAQLSSQFAQWKKLHPDSSLRYLDQTSIDSWVKATFPAGLLAREWSRMEAAPRRKKDRRLLEAVRQDIWRALVVLQRAGMTIYADSDTGSVRPFEEWGKIEATSLTMPLLSLLPTLTALPSADDKPSIGEEGPPSLVLSLEYDATAGGDGWDKNTFDRGMQFALWTFAGSQGHPVLVDYVGRAINLAHASRAKVDISANVLKDWAGPGLFSDCVFRYLLARWGVAPHEIGHHSGPVRIGDVLILPPRSFQADVSEHSTGTQDCVWHGFFSRWTPSELEKDDQLIDEDGVEDA